MGYTMHVIAPHHMAGDDPNSTNFPLQYCDLYKYPWYSNDIRDTYHEVWRCWRHDELHDGTKLPDLLAMTLVYSPWDNGFRDKMNAFFVVQRMLDNEVMDYLDWIDYWKQKGAQFYLSM